MSALRAHVPPELVVFDVDGTLHDTFRWWSPIIRAGLQRFADQHGLQVTLPSDREAEAAIGAGDERYLAGEVERMGGHDGAPRGMGIGQRAPKRGDSRP